MANNLSTHVDLNLPNFLIAYSVENPGMFTPRFLFALIYENEFSSFLNKNAPPGDQLTLNPKQRKILNTVTAQTDLILDDPRLGRREAMKRIGRLAFYIPGFGLTGMGACATRQSNGVGLGLPLIGFGAVLALMGGHLKTVNEEEKRQMELLTNSPEARKELLAEAKASDDTRYQDLISQMPRFDLLFYTHLRTHDAASVQPAR